MGQFLDINEPPKLNEDEINNLYRHITPSEIERVIKNLITKKKIPQGQMDSMQNYPTHSKKNSNTPQINPQNRK